MDTKTWVGVAFAGVLVLFFMIVSVLHLPPNPQRDKIFRLIGAICGGAAAAGFLSGDLVTNVTGNSLAVTASGSVGFAVVIWFTWGRVSANTPGFNATFPNATSFRFALETIARAANGSVALGGFSPEQENAPLKFNSLTANSPRHAMEQVRNLLGAPNFPAYSVRQTGSNFEVIAAQ